MLAKLKMAYQGITYPLLFKIFKPRSCLQKGDEYKTKPQLAQEIIQELKDWGFRIKLVLADSLYGESGDVIGLLPDPSGAESWYIMTNLQENITLDVAPLYSLRNWIEYGFKQVKNELGWANFRLTDYPSIERWWEIVMSAYLLVSIQANYFRGETTLVEPKSTVKGSPFASSVGLFSQHPRWEKGTTWKSALNNLRLIIQPFIFSCLIKPWLQVFKIPGMKRCFLKLIELMNQFRDESVLDNLTVDFEKASAC